MIHVATYAAMKSGLKDRERDLPPRIHRRSNLCRDEKRTESAIRNIDRQFAVVATYAAMKSGLKGKSCGKSHLVRLRSNLCRDEKRTESL